ncbi:MAG: UDP-N-acetylenolpyruvoylglucosamine reductase [Candidatus Nomurabacteria bacterium GW2011_GWA2_40_9]|uniref:UDP-N-acetylenolpyruvoylglucosamine reductase n=1 Tax=Candidatus Nomurabacteria bacterium GW2011_GWA2_40_9 TaxID=1618734 RepID=A0A0G0W3R4_9BACT|nr:MAG: UDP-N-acetylenolpyruvoylglucosamine reductase [Candidatus Nomurabacteria bacterium GW2011_GWA2_40_9]
MKIEQNFDLKNLNTFGVSAKARFFVELYSEAELLELLNTKEFKKNTVLFLGGGSNVLFTKDWDGIVVFNKIKGIEVVKVPTPEGVGIPTENVGKDFVWVKAMSGEIWHDLVEFAVSRDYWGIENLSFIPGTVGAAPIQNIGAYGGELKDTMESLEAVEIQTGEKKVFYNKECEFGYRDSIFKNKVKGKYFILSVTLKLSKKENKNIEYKVLKEYIEKNNTDTSASKNISEAVATIRRSKLPDTKVIGNAGSFFKNVFVSEEKFKELQDKYPDMPYFLDEEPPPNLPLIKGEGKYKIPAGWLIEQCGWKGKRVGNVGVHDKQALVIVNHGGATGVEIKNLAKQIINVVYFKFGVKLIPEVNLI